MSEYPVGTRVQKYQYVERDRLQSGISQAVLIIEAQIESGTMHTAEYARRQARRLACYAARLLEMSSGNQYLEENGNTVILQNDKDMINFLRSIINTPQYEQMTLMF